MAKKKIMLSLVCVVACLAVWALAAENQPEKTKVRIGIFDSRAVAIAYAHSDWNKNRLKARMPEMEKAKAAGDTKKIEELEAWGQAQQDKLHKQGFGTASVCDLLEHIKDDIPKIAKENGVDVIVNKWDIVYQNPAIEMIDITSEIVKPFNPNEKTLKSIRAIQNHPPVSEEVLEKIHCEQSAKNK